MKDVKEFPPDTVKKGKVYLPCKLTQKEIYESGKSLADALKRVDECEVRLEGMKQQIKAEITQAQGEAAKFRSLVATEVEHRMVDVEVRLDWRRGKKETVRMDTGELLRTDDITDEERQRELNLSTEKK